jgi:hypothetical protein
LIADGVLDSTTYLTLRNQVIGAALDGPRAVIVDVTRLAVPAPSAWAAFTSARWHVSQWSDVPIVLVCAQRAGRDDIDRFGVTRRIPVYQSTQEAIAAVSRCPAHPPHRRAQAELPATAGSVVRSRELVSEWLRSWSQGEFTAVAKMIVTVFVENVLVHTDGAPSIRVESHGSEIRVAVEDDSTIQAGRSEASILAGDRVSGLAIVGALSRRWGNTPIPSGKMVWATVGIENCI